MSERDLRRRVSANRRAISNTRAPRPSPSPSPASRRRIRPAGGGKLSRLSENAKGLKRSKSEPWLVKFGGGEVAAAVTAAAAEEEEDEEVGVLYRPRTCTDIFSSPDNSLPRSPGYSSEGYNRDAKVVVNVTVEGSPGPIRTMVKLGSNVDEMIKLVVKKYNQEGRTPHLDKDAASSCELHHSYFSLESLSKSDLIGDVGSRSFYLRRRSSISVRSDESRIDTTSASSNQLLPFLPSFIDRKIKKIFRRTRKFWKILGCISCTG